MRLDVTSCKHTLRVLLPCKWNILLKCTQQIEIHNTGVHVMAKAAQTTTLHHAMGCKYFRSAELILLLLDHVIIEIRRCLKITFHAGDSFLPHPQNSHCLSNDQPSQHQLKLILYQMLPNLRKSIAIRKVSRLGHLSYW